MAIQAERDFLTRQQEIMDIVQREGRIRVSDYAKSTGVSDVTIRKDLDRMAKEGMLKRIHGGAACFQPCHPDHDYVARRQLRRTEKQKIANECANLINAGDSILINVGSTSEYVIEALKGKQNISVITNAFPIVTKLLSCDTITTFFLGGCLNTSMQITTGDNVIEQLSKYTADKLIMGMDGIDPVIGLTSRNHVEDYIMHKMMAQSKQKILVADDSKIGNSSFVRIASITEFDILVTNYAPDKEEILKQIEKAGVQVIRAK